jgi:hypothetical protein
MGKTKPLTKRFVMWCFGHGFLNIKVTQRVYDLLRLDAA